ncbi:MAG: hypothetical protein QXD48_01145 [Candidatus Aenigmatarchaeota archaeon]
MTEIIGIILSVITMICFGFSTAIQKYALNKIEKFSIKSVLKNKMWLSTLIISAIGIATYLFALRISYLSLVQSIVSSTLIIPMFVGFVFFKEKLVIYEWISIILILIGIILVVY